VRGICFTTHITDHAPATPAPFANFVHSDAKTVARRHSAADHWSAIRAHDHTVMRPARGGEIERARAHVCLQLGRPTEMRKAERLCVDGPPSNKNGQATSGPAMLVQRGVYVDHQALPQTAFLPFGRPRRPRISEEPNTMLHACPLADTTSSVNQWAAALSPSRGTRRRREEARPWSCPGTPKAERRPPGRRGICPGGSSPAAPASPRPPRSP